MEDRIKARVNRDGSGMALGAGSVKRGGGLLAD